MKMSENMPDLKFYVEASDVPGSVFSSELELKAGKWIIYESRIREFLEMTPVGV
jgi:hypothetical protein